MIGPAGFMAAPREEQNIDAMNAVASADGRKCLLEKKFVTTAQDACRSAL